VISAYKHRRGLHFMFPLPSFHAAVSCGFHLNKFWLSLENMKLFILWSFKFWGWCRSDCSCWVMTLRGSPTRVSEKPAASYRQYITV